MKFDFLGLKTLTVLQKAVELVKRGRGIDIDLLALPLDDPKAFELLAKADTVGVFQLEGTGMRESLKRLKPDRFEDIIAMVALYRPGPMDNIPTYINRKHGEEPVDCLHPMLEPILKETYGVIIYQEQVMQIAQVLAGYSLGQADLLRRAMGKKDKAEMAQAAGPLRRRRRQERRQEGEADYIFELVDKFAGYGFNKSHAAAYALVSLSHGLSEGELPRGVPRRLDDARHGQHRQARHVRRPRRRKRHRDAAAVRQRLRGRFPRRAEKDGAIRYSLAALKNIGAQAVATIVAERSRQGPLQGPGRLRRAAQPEGAQQARARDAGRRRRLRCAGAEPRAGARQRRADPGAGAAGGDANAASGTDDLFGGGASDRAAARPARR